MKRILSILFMIALLVGLTACGSKNDVGNDPYLGEEEPNSTVSGNPTTANTLSEALAWWDGEWYGYWTVYSASGYYEDWEDCIWDCYAIISVEADGTAEMYLWDDDMEMALAHIAIEESGGVGPMGSATSEGGKAFNVPLRHADWVIVPTTAEYKDYYGNPGYDDYMEFEGYCEDEDGDDFHYTVVLRPWGMLWDDIPAEKRPPYHDAWYKDEGIYKMSMYDAMEEYEPDPGEISDVDSADSTAGGGAGLLGPTEEITLGEIYTFSYPTSTFDYDDMILPRLRAKDESVVIRFTMQRANESMESIIEFLDSYNTFEGYSSEDITIAGYEARRITYKDWGGEDVSKVFIDFNFTGEGTNGYRGVIAEIMSEKDLASTWTAEIKAMLETSRVNQ